MFAVEPRVRQAVWAAIKGHLPEIVDNHPLGCHRQRTAAEACFYGLMIRLITGASWTVVAWLSKVSSGTLRRRRDEWIKAGVFEKLEAEALAAYDRILGLDLEDVAVDGSLHKAPAGGALTGPNPTDRAKGGWKLSLATDKNGVPIAWAEEGANRHDSKLFGVTLEMLADRRLLPEVGVFHLDRGYNYDFIREAVEEAGAGISLPRGAKAKTKTDNKNQQAGTKGHSLGARWPVERTNSWFTNYGQMRRNTDRKAGARKAAISFTVAFILTIKLVKYSDRWSPNTSPIG